MGTHCFDPVLVDLHSKKLEICLAWPLSLQSMVLLTESKSHPHVLNCLLFAPLAFPAGNQSRAPAGLAGGSQQPDLGMCERFPQQPCQALPREAPCPSSRMGISVSRRALGGFHLCREMPPAPQATTRPQQLLQFVVSASACEWTESPAQVCGVSVASSCAVFLQLLCLFS